MPLAGEYEPSPQKWARDQIDLYERSGGTQGTTLDDQLIVVLTTLGRTSGKLRKVALIRVEHDGVYAAVASLGGGPQDPVWYGNALSHPRVELQDGPLRCDMTTREVKGAEKAVWWERAVAAFPDYADYQVTAKREIPMLVLEPELPPTPYSSQASTPLSWWRRTASSSPPGSVNTRLDSTVRRRPPDA